MARVLRRLDMTAKSFFAVVDPESCFAGSLLEILLASDRSYVLEDPGVKFSTELSTVGRFCAETGRPVFRCAVMTSRGAPKKSSHGRKGPISAE